MSTTNLPADGTGEFDYIVGGAGAGGGPLAARLVLAGKRVLLVDAGPDVEKLDPIAPAREATDVPVFSGIASERAEIAWEFFVKHYKEEPPPPPVGEDPKWVKGQNPEKTGIFYPRSSGLGGCTVHNAMITIAGPDSDWNQIADFLDDPSWRAQEMRTYFQRLEHNQYFPPPPKPARTWFGKRWDDIRWLFGKEIDYTSGQHGYGGWLRTSIADVALALKDLKLINMLLAAVKGSEHAGTINIFTVIWNFILGRVNQILDPNHAKTMAQHPEGLALIPIAVTKKSGEPDKDGTPSVWQQGHRSSPREFLLDVQRKHPDKLVILTNAFVTELLFEEEPKLRAVGVKVALGDRLYHACKTHNPPPEDRHELKVRHGGEVILSGGSYNSPQVLKLSGIGPKDELARHGIPTRVHSPGVGKNLQDRYEVTVISEMDSDFSLLKNATLALPTNPREPDPYLNQWRQNGTGLYATNGAVLAILKRSNPELPQPDLFVFGLPFSFRGYAPGYSADIKHNYFTWAILKAHTQNRGGTVELRSTNPFETPVINYNYFPGVPPKPGDKPDPDKDPDLAAVLEGVHFVRSIAKRAWWSVKQENYPGIVPVPDNDDKAIRDWIRRVAWGHHACGTCRMGPANDAYAVIDSRFRLLGEAPDGHKRPVIEGLRIVDASIFPKIPGVFIVTNVYMASEKAADVILADAKAAESGLTYAEEQNRVYPQALFKLEADAIDRRRAQVSVVTEKPPVPAVQGNAWSRDVTGLAISGGGVRSATFGLGALNGLAKHGLLRYIDFMSTVSGGGYSGSALGRAYDRYRLDPETLGQLEGGSPPTTRVEEDLKDLRSPFMLWLREHANFIAPSGSGDGKLDLAVFLRNLFSVHFCIAALLIASFGLVDFVRYWLIDRVLTLSGLAIHPDAFPLNDLIENGLGVFWSPWFLLLEIVLLFGVFPRIVGYWLASEDEIECFQPVTLTLVFFLAGGLAFIGIAGPLKPEPLILAASLLAGLWSVTAAWRRGRQRENAVGSGDPRTQRRRTRSYLTYDLGLWLGIAGLVGLFSLVDTAGFAIQQAFISHNVSYTAAFARLGAAIAALVPILRWVANYFAKPPEPFTPPSAIDKFLRQQVTGILTAGFFLLVPLIFYAFAVHAAYDGGNAVRIGAVVTIAAIVVTALFAARKALPFVNRSSLTQTYAARLSNTFLGASNPERQHPSGQDITEVIPNDDVSSIADYKPYEAGGPFHILNVTVNQTVDFASGRDNADRKGESLAVSSLGMSVGLTSHSLFPDAAKAAGLKPTPNLAGVPSDPPRPSKHGRYTALIPAGYVPGGDHPLVADTGVSTYDAETLSLRQWMTISAAAIGPARGAETSLGTSLIFGLANLRTGYWWDSGIDDAMRASFPDLGFLQRFLYLLPRWYVTQSLLVSEWVGRFAGPWNRYWALSDGGFFEVTGVYELLRRKVPRIVLLDASEDPLYQNGGFAELERKARLDFEAHLAPLSPDEFNAVVPPEARVKVGSSIDDLKAVIGANGTIVQPPAKHGTVFKVTYVDGSTSLLLLLKASVTGDEPIDVLNYQATNPQFPQESTADQFYTEPQWESYRRLGEHVAGDLAWFVK